MKKKPKPSTYTLTRKLLQRKLMRIPLRSVTLTNKSNLKISLIFVVLFFVKLSNFDSDIIRSSVDFIRRETDTFVALSNHCSFFSIVRYNWLKIEWERKGKMLEIYLSARAHNEIVDFILKISTFVRTQQPLGCFHDQQNIKQLWPLHRQMECDTMSERPG